MIADIVALILRSAAHATGTIYAIDTALFFIRLKIKNSIASGREAFTGFQ